MSQIERACRAVISLIPQWYFAECGPNEYKIAVDGTALKFYSHRKMTPELKSFFSFLRSRLPIDLKSHLVDAPGFSEVLQEQYALHWLSERVPSIKWAKGIEYLSEMSLRTSENNPVAINLIVGPESGTVDVTSNHFQKLFDQLAASQFTYFRVDKEFRLNSFKEIAWSQITDSATYKFHPEFLHPFSCVLGPNENSLHLTSRGDIIVMSKEGLMATKRKGKWKLYDLATFKNSLTDCIGSYQVGANLIEVLFDLSFRRHGALLIYDPKKLLNDKIVNPQSILPEVQALDSPQAVLTPSIQDMAIGVKVGSLKNRRLLAELASVDGAVVFDDKNLTAVGAMIRPHADAKSESGTRSTAALSAYKYGARPVKVSSDGEITFYFESCKGEEKKCDARIEFL